MNKVDLHIHTTASDGALSPSEVVDWAVKKKLKAIAITDHDTTLGIEEAIKRAAEYQDFYVVPGIELSSDFEGEEIHILGYFINYMNSEILNITNILKESRMTRGKKMIDKLRKMGLDITFDEVKKITDKKFIGRPHIAKILISKGYAKDIQDAFDRYIGRGKPAYENRYKLSVSDSIKLIHNSGGVAIIAHPGLIKNNKILDIIIRFEIDGLEAIHSKHNDEKTEELCNYANINNLIYTGGSDCHGSLIGNQPMLGDYFVDYEIVEKMKRISEVKYKG